MKIAGHNLQNRVPYDAKVEWIYTPQRKACIFIDEITFTHYELKINLEENVDRQYFGLSTGHGWFQVRTYDHRWRSYDGSFYMGIVDEDGNEPSADINIDLVIKSPYEGNDYKWIINDQEYLYQLTKGNTITGSIGIFYCTSTAIYESYMGGGKFYYAKVWNKDTLVADLIPVMKYGVGMLYDRVTHRLYGSYTENNFQAGPEI